MAEGHELTELLNQIEDCDNRIAENPKDWLALFERGLAKIEMELHKDAIKDFSRAIRHKPDLAAAYLNRSVAYETLGDEKQAKRDHDEYERLRSERPGP